MSHGRNPIKSYFDFSKKELNGIFLLFILMTFVLAVPYLYPLFVEEQKYDFERFKVETERFRAAINQNEIQQNRGRIKTVSNTVNPQYFEFDPNRLSEEHWLQLGLSLKQIRVIRNYEQKGGRFLKREDLKKIYSISPDQYKRLEPFIRINNAYSKHDTAGFRSNYKQAESLLKVSAAIIELNAADSVQLVGIRGIGPAFASRILRFRNRLGGFYRKEQLLEVYGIDSVKFRKLRDLIEVNAGLIRMINLNNFTFEEIKNHPYLTYKQMNAIVQYRIQHGSFKSIDDLKNIAILNEEIIRKIEPYIALKP